MKIGDVMVMTTVLGVSQVKILELLHGDNALVQDMKTKEVKYAYTGNLTKKKGKRK